MSFPLVFVIGGRNATSDISDQRSCLPIKVHAGGGFAIVRTLID